MSSDLHSCNLGENILRTRMGSADTEEKKGILLHSKYYDWLLEDSTLFLSCCFRRVLKESDDGPRFIWQSTLSIFDQNFLFHKYYTRHSHIIYMV